MKTLLGTVAVAAFLVGCRTEGPNGLANHADAADDCLNRGYARYSCDRPATIPDALPEGIAIGPVPTGNPGSRIAEVVVQIDLVHASPGDLMLWLSYDCDNDGMENARAPLELHKARPHRCDVRDPFACPSMLDGTYYFREESGRTGIDGYSVSLFDGLPSGGSFYLGVADTMVDDVGTVRRWAVYVRKAEPSVAGDMRQREDPLFVH